MTVPEPLELTANAHELTRRVIVSTACQRLGIVRASTKRAFRFVGCSHERSLVPTLRLSPFIRLDSRPFAVDSLCPRMGLVVGLLQPLNRDMRINLCGRKALVAEQGLNAAKISAIF